MEVFVYAVYLLIGLAAFSVLEVTLFARLPADVLRRGQRAGRFADLGVAQASSSTTPAAGSRVTTFDAPKARAA